MDSIVTLTRGSDRCLCSVPIISILLLFVAGASYTLYSLCFSPYCHVPGPWPCKITSLYASYFDIRLQRTSKIHEWHKKYGNVVLVAPGEVSFSSYSATRQVYGAGGRHPKSRYFDHFLSYGGERATFNTLDYQEHRERRKLSFAFFQPATAYSEPFVQPVRCRARAFVRQIELDLCQTFGTVDMFQRINYFAFDNVTRLLFGTKYSTATVDKPCSSERAMLGDLKHCEMWNTLRFNMPWAHKIARTVISQFTHDKRFLCGEAELDEWCKIRAEAAMQDILLGQDRGDVYLLKHLSQLTDKSSGERLPTRWIFAEVLDNVGAAQATVTVALTYVIWNIACSPAWQDRIRLELQALAVQEDGFPSFADINDAPILEACVKESYRLNPLSSGRAERIVPEGKEYDGVFLPTGTIISTSTVAIQHTPWIFPSPGLYNPGRWLEANPDHLRLMQSHYIPFGYGARVCLGKPFATLEVKLLTAFLLLRFSISPVPGGRTNTESMRQVGTQDALPRGLGCDVLVRRIEQT